MNSTDRTLDLHRNGGLNCSQAILTAFGESAGIDPGSARALGRPWAGGIAHRAGTCGYLSGAILVLARAYDNGDEKAARERTFQAVQRLFKRFIKRRGSTRCKDLLGADMTTPEGKKRIKEKDLVAERCHCSGGIGQDVSEILEDLLR